jgi:hypothetical protein
MDKKKILIGVGIIALIGGIYYFYNKSKKADTGNAGGESTGTSTGTSTGSADAGTPATETAVTTATKKALTSRKDKKKACGRRPVNKTKRAEWEKCVDAGGTSSFQGDFDEFEETYLDFDNSYDISF